MPVRDTYNSFTPQARKERQHNSIHLFVLLLWCALVPSAAVAQVVIPIANDISTIAGNGTAGFTGDGGLATSAEIHSPYGVAVDVAGNIYIADQANNCIRKVTATTADISTLAGDGTAGYSGDGGLAINAELNGPTGIAVDRAGNLYIADASNNRVRAVNTGSSSVTIAGVAIAAGDIATIAGNGTAGFSGDGGAATSAKLSLPFEVTVDGAGDFFIADRNNNRVRKVTFGGTISTFAGNGTAGFSGDGGAATSAELHSASGVALDRSGNLYIADTANQRIRLVTASTGLITTAAGNGTAGFSGDGGAATSAELHLPAAVVVDTAGNLYIADTMNNRIRKVTAATGKISTFAGNGTGGFSGDGGAATSAEVNLPFGVTLDTAGDVYIGDTSNNRVRIVGMINFFVSPSGSDGNTGTSLSSALLTFDKARSKVQSVAGTEPITVVLAGGTYYNTSVIFNSPDSGTATNPIVYTNYPGQTPILSGGARLSGTYTFSPYTSGVCLHISNCWKTTLGSGFVNNSCSSLPCYFERLWYNNSVRFRPRTGATASALVGAYGHYVSSTQPYNVTVSSTDPGLSNVTSWKNLNDVELFDTERWVVNIQRLASVSTGSGSVTFTTTCTAGGSGPGACSNPNGAGLWITNERYVFDNVRELLLLPGQWYLDRLCSTCASSPTLYYIALNSTENPNTDNPGIVVGQNNQVLSLNSTSPEYVTFQGLQFQNDNYTLPNGTPTGALSGYASSQLDPQFNYAGVITQNSPSAMVGCYPCNNVTFNLDTFTQTTASALEFLDGSANDTVENSLFFDIGASGIKVGNATSIGSAPNNILITNNAVLGTSRYLGAGDAIAIGVANNIEVSFNNLGHSYHDGIEACKPSATSPTYCNSLGYLNFHDNDIHDIMRGVTSDGGCIYTMTAQNSMGSSLGNVLTHNRCHDVNDARAQYLNNSSFPGNGYGGNCWYHDQTSGLVTDKDNLCYRATGTGFKLTAGPQVTSQPNTSQNNIYAFVMSSVAGVTDCVPSSGILQFNFENNIVAMDQYPSAEPWEKPGATDYSMQLTNGAYFYSPVTSTQLWTNNYYFNYNGSGYGTGTKNPAFYHLGTNCGGTVTTFPNFAGWQGFGEDSGSSDTTNPGFTAATTPCTSSNDPYYPAPNPGVCDDFSFVSGSPTNFTAFSVSQATSNVPENGFGQYPVPGLLPVPTSLTDTFLTATFPAIDF
jgi:sugar lactone lactonase YvrE